MVDKGSSSIGACDEIAWLGACFSSISSNSRRNTASEEEHYHASRKPHTSDVTGPKQAYNDLGNQDFRDSWSRPTVGYDPPEEAFFAVSSVKFGAMIYITVSQNRCAGNLRFMKK